uniref:Uncharacterized protein n=1 Tax=Schistosoma curassoni TaxID=6186 RepID=A0A183KHV2_9TREM
MFMYEYTIFGLNKLTEKTNCLLNRLSMESQKSEMGRQNFVQLDYQHCYYDLKLNDFFSKAWNMDYDPTNYLRLYL